MKKKIVIIIAVLVLLILSLFLITRPVKQFDEVSIDEATLTDLVGDKLLDSAMDMLIDGTNGLVFELTEAELNGMIAGSLKNQDDIKGIHCIIHEDEIVLYIDTTFRGIINTQIIIHTNMTLVDRQMNIQLRKVSIGRLPLPKSIILNMLKEEDKNIVIDQELSTIMLPIELPEVTSIEDFMIQDNRIRFKLKVSITSMSDVLSLIEYFEEKEK